MKYLQKNPDSDVVGPGPGFEPGRQAPQAFKNAGNQERGKILGDFKSFCEVDSQLSDLTVHGHIKQIERFLKALRKPLRAITKQDIREYLMSYKNVNPNTYANVLKSLKVFFRDFLTKKNLVESFKFPNREPSPKIVPSKEQLHRFYEALKNPRDRAMFLIYATTGLRTCEVMSLSLEDINLEKRMIIPKNHQNSKTKHSWIAFYNSEAEQALRKYLDSSDFRGPKLFNIRRQQAFKIFRKTSKRTGIKITPQNLREWFSSELGSLGVQDRYVDAFCGRVPKSVLARHYTDYSPLKLERIYEKAELRVLS